VDSPPPPPPTPSACYDAYEECAAATEEG
jgi:hypothetical protein